MLDLSNSHPTKKLSDVIALDYFFGCVYFFFLCTQVITRNNRFEMAPIYQLRDLTFKPNTSWILNDLKNTR